MCNNNLNHLLSTLIVKEFSKEDPFFVASLIRHDRVGTATTGTLTVQVFSGDNMISSEKYFSLENKRFGYQANSDLAIPTGLYRARRTSTSVALPKGYKESFVISKEGVSPDRRIIFPHIGNTEKDTLGCILLGESSVVGERVFESTSACRRFLEQTQLCSNGILEVVGGIPA